MWSLVLTLSLFFFFFAFLSFKAQDSADIIFLIDGSQNTGKANFDVIRDFLVNVLERLSVGNQQVRVGVVQYSDEPRTMFSLDSYPSKAAVLDAVKRLSFAGGELANIGQALDFVVENHFTRTGGSRVEEGVPQVLVLISAGPSSDEIRDAVVALKQGSVFSFGLGAQAASRVELQHIATDDSLVFTVPEFRSFGDLQEQLLPYLVGVAQRHIVLQQPAIVTQGMYAFFFFCHLYRSGGVLYGVCHKRKVGTGVIHLGRTRKYSQPVVILGCAGFRMACVWSLHCSEESKDGTSEWTTLLEHGLYGICGL